MKQRLQVINSLIEDVRVFEGNTLDMECIYAIDAIIEFLEASKTVRSYADWLFHRAFSLDPSKLLEISDLSMKKWEQVLHDDLARVERSDFPGLIMPLRKKIIEFIHTEKPSFLLNLGCGSMELEAQVIEQILGTDIKGVTTFLGIDNSKVLLPLIKKRFEKFIDQIEYYYITNLSQEELELKAANCKKKILVVLTDIDVFSVNKFFKAGFFDLVFYSKFRHHLNEADKKKLKEMLSEAETDIIEFDGYRNWAQLLPQSIFAWQKPVLLNGAIFSRLRCPTKENILARGGEADFFSKQGSYILKFKKK